MERCLLDNMPYEILFEIFSGLSKGKLTKISRLCSKFRDIAGDTRLWKDVYIKYESCLSYAFEELYSGPSVKVIDLSLTKINPPVSSQISQVVKVTKLILSAIQANKVTMAAILDKYQCTELYMDVSKIDPQGHVLGILPETLSKQTALDVLSLQCLSGSHKVHPSILDNSHQWLTQVLSKYCKNLKTLELTYAHFRSFQLIAIVKSLPTSLEKLCITNPHLENSFFELLAKRIPRLRILQLRPENMKCPSLLQFQFLEALQFDRGYYRDISVLYVYLVKFPALKNVYIDDNYSSTITLCPNFKKLQMKLESHGIIVGPIKEPSWKDHVDDNFWEVQKTM